MKIKLHKVHKLHKTELQKQFTCENVLKQKARDKIWDNINPH